MTDGRSDSDVKDHGRESATPCGDAEPAFVKNASFCGKAAFVCFQRDRRVRLEIRDNSAPFLPLSADFEVWRWRSWEFSFCFTTSLCMVVGGMRA